MFRKEKYLKLAEACIRRAASLHAITIIEISVMSEHVHVVVQISMNVSPSKALNILKGLSAKLFFEYHEKARLRYPRGHLWSRGSFASSVGFVQAEVVRNYVRNQEGHIMETYAFRRRRMSYNLCFMFIVELIIIFISLVDKISGRDLFLFGFGRFNFWRRISLKKYFKAIHCVLQKQVHFKTVYSIKILLRFAR